MKFIITEDYDEMSKVAADMVIEQIKNNPESILGLATGSSPIGLYKQLIKAHKEGLDFSKVKTFNLDEYYGLTPDHPQSYRYFMNDVLFNHINIDQKNVHIPSGIAKDVEKECKDYDKSVEDAGGVDLQVLGIGRNGHIAFNEPEENLALGTHLTGLTENTINANSRFFDSMDDVPKKALTMGIGTIMKAKKIVLVASGKDKAPVIRDLTRPCLTTNIPASMLHLHNDVTIIVDKDAASLMNADCADC
jgi:glucosamine-6-phosphate deaminase